MATKILIKNSTSAGAAPSAGDIDQAELAVNLADKKLYTKNGSTVVELGTAPSSITSAGTVQFGTLSDGTIGITDFVDEDNMSSNSNVKLPTQQSVKAYVDTSITNLIDGAPGSLNTLNELAAALNDDAGNVYTAIGAKLPLAGGTMSGALAMGTSKITGLGNPTDNQDAVTKAYVTATSLPLAGGTLSGAVAMGTNKITGLGNPTANQDAVTKAYVTSTSLPLAGGTLTGNLVLGSNKATSTANPSAADDLTRKAYVDSIAGSGTSAAAALADFDSVYQRGLSSAPSADRNGNALTAGDLYFDTDDDAMYVYDGSSWGVVSLSPGITAGKSATFGSGAADDDFLRINGTTIEGRSASEVLSDIGGQASLTFGIGTGNVPTFAANVADDDFLRIAGTTVEGRSAAEVLSDMGVTATAAELNYLDIATLGSTAASKAVTADANNVVRFTGGIHEEFLAVTSSSAATTINLRLGTSFLHDLTEATTFTFTNPPAEAGTFVLKIIQDSSARAITWPSSVDWPAATAPTLTATNNGVDVFVFTTCDGGTIWYGFTAGQAMG